MKEKIQLIPISKIRILNPRKRSRKKFQDIVTSIRDSGLKKPIKVSVSDANDGTYDLVYGQGRMEACLTLGHDTIPAIVVNVPREDRLLMSLVENIARRHPRAGDVMREILRLKAEGDSQTEIARKMGFSDATICCYLTLYEAGEERLLDAALTDKIPVGVAVEIARVGDVDDQRALHAAYERGDLGKRSIRSIKKVIDQRRHLGKGRNTGKRKPQATAEAMLLTLRRDAEKKRAMVKKATTCENRLTLIVSALRLLLSDEDFRNLLRAEKLVTLPEFLAEKLHGKIPDAA